MIGQRKLKSNEKIYQLSEDEVNNLKGRDRMADYVLDLIQRDINMFLVAEIFKRLNLPMTTKCKISDDRTQLIVDTSPEIIIPGKGGDK